VKLLLEKRANPNVRNYDGNTPLMIAKDEAMIKALMAEGADDVFDQDQDDD
jgi:ankyrin repeat protein